MSNVDNNTTISTQIITASLTMITVIGAFFVFVIEKREIGFLYYFIIGLSFLSFIISIFLGGKGLSGKGKSKTPNPYFNWQAITALFGVVLFCVSIFLGKEKPNELELQVEKQKKQIYELKIKDEFRVKRMEEMEKSLSKLKAEIEKIRKDTVPNKVYKSLGNK